MIVQEAEDRGEDMERTTNWQYTIEDVERWNDKQQSKKKHINLGFTGI